MRGVTCEKTSFDTNAKEFPVVHFLITSGVFFVINSLGLKTTAEPQGKNIMVPHSSLSWGSL